MTGPKRTFCELMSRSEEVYGYNDGEEVFLMRQAEVAIEKLLSGLGPNAKGEFRISVSFWADGKAAAP